WICWGLRANLMVGIGKGRCGMRYGFVLPGADVLSAPGLALEAEEAGWDGVFIPDCIEIEGGRWCDSWWGWARMAMRTERGGVGGVGGGGGGGGERGVGGGRGGVGGAPKAWKGVGFSGNTRGEEGRGRKANSGGWGGGGGGRGVGPPADSDPRPPTPDPRPL